MAKVTKHKSEKQEAEHWDNHSLAEFWYESEEAKIELEPQLQTAIKERAKSRLKMVSLRLREDQIEAVKAIAAEKDIPYQTLLRSWINQAIKAEDKNKSPIPS